MLDQLDALRALRDTGSTARAAVRLRITQSAISKRISALEVRCGGALVVRQGRHLKLSALGEQILAEATPLLERLQAVLSQRVDTPPHLVLGASESFLGAWLPEVLRAVAPPVILDLHVFEGRSLVERLGAGALEAAICVDSGHPKELAVLPLGAEPMVLVGDLAPDSLDIWSIDEGALTGAWLARRMHLAEQALGRELRVVRRLESFVVLVRMAMEGFATVLAPLGIVRAMGVSPLQIHPLPLSRPLAWICRPSLLERPEITALVARLQAHPKLGF